MDGEFLGLLPRVCRVLADPGKSLPDDTSLEKLLDWFTEHANAGQGESLLEVCPYLMEFISTVIHNTASDPSVLSFTLKLTGLLAASEKSFVQLQEHSILILAYSSQRWQEVGLWEDPCMRIGWIQGLRSMLQHSMALHFLVESELTKPLLQLQTDSSLFVASAANQVLVHILAFFQPVSSRSLNGMDKIEEQEERTPVPTQEPAVTDADTEHLADSMGTSPEYTTATMAILEHLKVSLVPEEKADLQKSLQSLKLLALLLAQARAPLRAMLLKTILASLEALVTAGHSQITIPLMNVLLTAYSCPERDGTVPDQTVSRLLSAMLDTHNPPDVLHAAAAILRRGLCDSDHTAKAVRILLLPLDIITGLSLLSKHNAAPQQQHCSVSEEMNSKSSCISMICVCLTYTPQITLMPPSLLSTSPVSVVTSVLSLLRVCGGQAPSSSIGSGKACRNVIGCGKIQRCGLEALAALGTCPGAEEKLSEVFLVLMQYLHSPDSDPIVLQKCYQAVVKWLSVCSDLSSIEDQLGQDLLPAVRRRVCDVRWEVRDSTLEFLGQLPGVCVSPASAWNTCASEALLGCSITPLLTEALCDPESYVRASAISALAQTLAPCWQQGAALPQEQAHVVSRLLEILSQDTEGFPRRAVVRFFITWLSTSSSSCSSSSSLLMTSLQSVLSRGSADLDWEVKVHTLELAQLLLEGALRGHRGSRPGSDTPAAAPTTDLTPVTHPYAVGSGQAHPLHTHTATHTEEADGGGEGGGWQAGVLRGLVEQGVVSALLSGLLDCDRPVALKACGLLISLREALGAPELTAIAQVSCELQGWGWGREVRECLEKRRGWTTGASGAASDRSTKGMQVDEMDSGEHDGAREDEREDESAHGSVRVGVCEVLKSLGLEERRALLSQSSDHVQNSPLSLLQDILTATDTQPASESHPAQEVIVDCY